MPIEKLTQPPYGAIMRSGPTIANIREHLRRSAQLTGSGHLEVVRSPDGYHLRDSRLPGFWVAVYKSRSGVTAPVDYAYDGKRLFVKDDYSIVEEDFYFFKREQTPLIELSENANVPDGAVAYAIPAENKCCYEFVWNGEANPGKDVELCNVTHVAIGSGGIDYYPARFQTFSPDAWANAGGLYDCFLVQWNGYALTTDGTGCYTGVRMPAEKALSIDITIYRLPVYGTTDAPYMSPDCEPRN